MLTRALRILNTWNISSSDQASLFGLEEAELIKWGTGDIAEWARDPEGAKELTASLRLIVQIDESLKQFHTTPGHDQLWLNSPNTGPTFDGRTPLKIIREHGRKGLLAVARHVRSLG